MGKRVGTKRVRTTGSAGAKLAGADWSVELESMATEPDLGKLGVYVQVESANRITMQSVSPDVTVVTLEGLVSGKLQVAKVDADGKRDPVKPIESGEGSVRLFMSEPAIIL